MGGAIALKPVPYLVRMKRLAFILFLFSMTASAQTLEQFMSHPIESNLAASADGKHIAWVVNDHGKRNIWVKSGTDLPRTLTEYPLDDGQELSQLVFSPNGTKLLYVRGSGANRAGQNPNPASLPEGTEQAIYYKELSSKSPPAKIVTGSSPMFFKDGIRVLFSKGGQIYESPLDINANPKLLFTARGSNFNPRFSPDGNEVLFVSDRGDHSFIGVYNFLRRNIRWIAPDVTNDDYPVWSPDGKQIAFIRTSGTKIGELNNLTGGNKFAIWVADAQSGIAKPIWKSPADDGGFAQSYVNTPLAWSASGRILFFSEYSGWNHIYSMTETGSDLKDITPGDGEVESFVADATGKFIYFDGNRTDINRRHIWKVDVATGSPIAVTSGEGIEMYPAFAGNVLYAFRSTSNTSKTLVRVDEVAKATVPVNPQKLTTFSSASFVKPEAVLLKAADGTTVHAQLFINRNSTGKRPGILFMHGGPIRQMLLGFHYSDYYIHCYAFNQYLASQGYAVLSVNFRSGTGYGRDFRRAKNQGPRGANEYQDVVAAAKHLQSLPEVDANKIGLWGGSYGGYLTAMGLARNPEIFKAGVDVNGVHDWSFNGQDATNSWGLQKTEAELALKSSPVSDLSKWTGPVLFVHGDDDRNVNFQQSVDLVEKLREKNVTVEVLVLPDEVHGFLRYESWKQVFEKAKDFFDRKLK
jgi:dipeptidyl aminopeptidase/acylaminoacyl peptidase